MEVARNATPLAIASRSLEKAQAWAKARNIPRAYGSYDELLADSDIDAVYIPLPTSLKKEWAIKTANAKKHVLLEKPLPIDLKELTEIVEACEKNGVQFMDGTMWLHSLRTAELENKIPELGRIFRLNAAFTFKAPTKEWLEGGNGRTNKAQEPQGCLECGWYPIGAILFAKRWEQPTKIQALNWTVNSVDTIVSISAAMWFADGTLAIFDCGYEACHRCYLEVAAEKGTLFVDDVCGGQGKSGNFNAYFENFIGSGYYKLDSESGKEETIKVTPCNHTQLMIEDMGALVLQKKVDPKWPKISVIMQRVMNGVFDSYLAKGQPINLK